jgi:hypothetical protein
MLSIGKPRKYRVQQSQAANFADLNSSNCDSGYESGTAPARCFAGKRGAELRIGSSNTIG